MRVQILVVSATVTLVGCTVGTNSRVSESEPEVWGRIDCQRGQGNPELQQRFEDAKATCSGRGNSAEVQVGNAGNSSCMTEQGYVFRTRTEHEAACQAVAQQPGKPTLPTKGRSSGVAKPAAPPPLTGPDGPAQE
jgi:hypothetical protein